MQRTYWRARAGTLARKKQESWTGLSEPLNSVHVRHRQGNNLESSRAGMAPQRGTKTISALELPPGRSTNSRRGRSIYQKAILGEPPPNAMGHQRCHWELNHSILHNPFSRWRMVVGIAPEVKSISTGFGHKKVTRNYGHGVLIQRCDGRKFHAKGKGGNLTLLAILFSTHGWLLE